MNKVLILLVLTVVAIGCDSGNVLITPGDILKASKYANIEGRRLINRDDIISAIYEQIGVIGWSIYMADDTYLEYDVSEVETFLAIDQVDKYEPLDEFRDCDDYTEILLGAVTKRFPGIPFGIIWRWKISINQGDLVLHSQNIFYDGYTGNVYIVEPMNDQVQIVAGRMHSNFILMKIPKQ